MPLALFMRQGCHLCEDMEQLLTELLPANSYALKRIDIDDDPELKAQFNEWVPVLMHEGVEICHHFLDLEAVQGALAGYNTPNHRE